MYSAVCLKSWAIIVPTRDATLAERLIFILKLLRKLAILSTSMSDNQPKCKLLQRTIECIHYMHLIKCRYHFMYFYSRKVSETRPDILAKAVHEIMNKYKNDIEIILGILPKFAMDTYAAVKTVLY